MKLYYDSVLDGLFDTKKVRKDEKILWLKGPDLGYTNYKGILQNVEHCSNNFREVSHVWSVS